LEQAEERLMAPETVANPLEATKGDLIDVEMKVESRLGTGGTATVFEVKHANRSSVLKLALKPEYNDRIRSEWEVLNSLRDDKIVARFSPTPIEIKGLAGFLMERAGDETLAAWLRNNGRPSLERLHSFGENLLDILKTLEEHGIAHRDIKPEN